MVWVEQPVGVGYSQGVPNITNEVELADEFRGFFKSFLTTFDMQGWDIYVTGESYAGFYVPYIADSFIRANDTSLFNLAGISINDPIIGDDQTQQQGKCLLDLNEVGTKTDSCSEPATLF
jgi:carboxypeptidase D